MPRFLTTQFQEYFPPPYAYVIMPRSMNTQFQAYLLYPGKKSGAVKNDHVFTAPPLLLF
jgi:hypothetical protein